MWPCLALTLALAAPPGLSAEEQRAVSWIDEHRDDAVELLRRLTEVSSGSGNPAGIRRVGEILQAELDRIGFRTWWEPAVAGSGRGPHLLAERNGTRGRRVLLIGHLDTVFEEDSPFRGFVRDGDEARGPGVLDMKGGDVVIVQALQALHAAGALEGTSIRVAFTGDEEDPGPLPESRRALRELAARSDVALGFEATAEGLDTATVARRGTSTWRLTTKGTAGHTSVVFSERYGSGAIFEMARILSAFHEELKGERYLTFSPGIVVGGGDVTLDEDTVAGTAAGKTNIIADESVVLGDLRVLTAEQAASIRERMRAIVARHLPGTTAEIEFRDGYPAMEPKPGNYAVLEELDRISRDLGQGPVTAFDPGRRGAGDISFVADLVDALDGIGATGRGSHTIDEAIDLAALPAITKRAALLVYRLTR